MYISLYLSWTGDSDGHGRHPAALALLAGVAVLLPASAAFSPRQSFTIKNYCILFLVM